jgi:hypothetical protein
MFGGKNNMFLEVTDMTNSPKLINADKIILIMPNLRKGCTLVIKDYGSLDVMENYSTLTKLINDKSCIR